MDTSTNQSERVIIIGGGIIGMLTARELLARGLETLVLDAGEGRGTASTGNAGIIAPGHPPIAHPGLPARALQLLLNHDSPLYIPPRPDPALLRWLLGFRRACRAEHYRNAVEILNGLSHLSLELWQELARDDSVSQHLNSVGWVEACCEEATCEDAMKDLALLHRDGFDAEFIDGDELRRRDPAFSRQVVGALTHPSDMLTDPAGLLSALRADVERLGGVVRHGCRIDSLLHDGRSGLLGVMSCHGEIIEGNRAVLSAGIWSDRFARSHGLRIPMQAAKGYHVMLSMEDPPRTACVCRETMVGVNPCAGGLRLAGTLELSGINSRFIRRRLNMLRTGASRYINGIRSARATSEWNGLRPCTADGLPVIGAVPGFKGAYVATGHGMMGVTLGPVTAKIIGSLLENQPPPFDITPLDPARF